MKFGALSSFVLYEMDRMAKVLGVCSLAIGVLYYPALALRDGKLVRRSPRRCT